MIAAPYLSAIQKIPGDTAGEKRKWLGKLSYSEEKASGDIDQLPPEMRPLLRVETAVRKKIHEDVTEALKSDDVTIVRRALQASWYFNGSHKDVVSVQYFHTQVFPYVSLNTRQHIIKTLAIRLKDKQFAQDIFLKLESIYGIECALPLIVACNENFAYDTITEKNIKLPLTIAKKFLRRNIDFIVRYLRRPELLASRSVFACIQNYQHFLLRLVKRRLDAFVELYEMHQKVLSLKLSNKCAEALLTNGMKYVLRNPKLYIAILPLKKIGMTRMEMIFPKLLPDQTYNFETDRVLMYLNEYPEDKRYDFLCRAYKEKYGLEFVSMLSNVTQSVAKLMPAEERVKYARIKIEKNPRLDVEEYHAAFNRELWISFLPTAESIPAFKRLVGKATTPDKRLGYLCQMVYTCKLNKDEDALLDFFKYYLSRHKNEESLVYNDVMEKIATSFDLPHLSERIWAVLHEIIVVCYVKHGWVNGSVLVGLIHHRLLHDIPITDSVEMLLETQAQKYYIFVDHVLEKDLYYKRRFLVVCLEVMEQKFMIDKWEKDKEKLVLYVVQEMYRYNEKCKQSSTKIELMAIEDYPWLLNILRQMIQPGCCNNVIVMNLLREHEPELYRSWFQVKEENHAEDVKTGAALKLLKRDPQAILDDWKKYLDACKTYYYDKNVHRFVRATRWYKDLPVWFLECCWESWQQQQQQQQACGYLVVMALLLHGSTMVKLVEPLIPTNTKLNVTDEDAREKYDLVRQLPLVMKLSNPPLPLEFVARLCQGDYLTVALMALTNACRRSPMPRVVSVATNLSEQRVSVTKHGVRMMYLVAPLQEFIQYLRFMWWNSKHHSIAAIVLKSAQHLFFNNPDERSWSLVEEMISKKNFKDPVLLAELDPKHVPVEYGVKYIMLLFNLIHDLEDDGLEICLAQDCIITMLEMVANPPFDQLPDSFAELLLRKYLFHEQHKISMAAINFTVSSFLTTTDEKRKTIFKQFLQKEVELGWDKYRWTKHGSYRINNTVSDLIDSFVFSGIDRNKSVKLQIIITEMLDIFLSVLTPQMEPQSYLLLVYAQLRAKNEIPHEFGLQIGRIIPDLVKTFTPMFLPFMSDVLNRMLQRENLDVRFTNVKYSVAVGLMEANTVESCFMAAKLLVEISPRNYSIDNEFEKLLSMNHPAISSILNDSKRKQW